MQDHVDVTTPTEQTPAPFLSQTSIDESEQTSLRQLLLLCLCHFVLFTGLAALVGLMPVYLTRLGADASITGIFLAFAYLSLAISHVVTGKLSDHLQSRRVLLIAGGLLAVPLTWLMSQTTSVVLLMVLMAAAFLATGTVMTMVDVLVGLFSQEGRRGRIFGILSFSLSFGLFFGALVSGPIVDRWGFPALFVLMALLYLIIPVAGWFIRDKVVVSSPDKSSRLGIRHVLSNRTFLFLFVACILAQAANCQIFLTRPLKMDTLNFDATTIASASAFGSLVTLPLPLLVGWLSDRLGRKQIIVACFLFSSAGLIAAAAAVDFWHFWVAAALQTILGMSIVPAKAVITDAFPQESLGTALSLLNSTAWIGIVLGLSAGGIAIRAFQMTPALMLAMFVSLAAMLLLIPVQAHRSVKTAEAA